VFRLLVHKAIVHVIAAFDTYHFDDRSTTGVVLFDDWTDSVATIEKVCRLSGTTDEYIPGEFYRRELPCILSALETLSQNIETVVVDSYVQLGLGRPGLGQKLFETLGGSVNVVGVAKTKFHSADDAIEIFRGQSTRPLYVSSAGIECQEAAKNILAMHGGYRIPTLLKLADKLSRSETMP